MNSFNQLNWQISSLFPSLSIRALLKLKRHERALLPGLLEALDGVAEEFHTLGTWTAYLENKSAIRLERRARQKGLLQDPLDAPGSGAAEESGGLVGQMQGDAEDTDVSGLGEGMVPSWGDVMGRKRSSASRESVPIQSPPTVGRSGAVSGSWGQSLMRGRNRPSRPVSPLGPPRPASSSSTGSTSSVDQGGPLGDSGGNVGVMAAAGGDRPAQVASL